MIIIIHTEIIPQHSFIAQYKCISVPIRVQYIHYTYEYYRMYDRSYYETINTCCLDLTLAKIRTRDTTTTKKCQ